MGKIMKRKVMGVIMLTLLLTGLTSSYVLGQEVSIIVLSGVYERTVTPEIKKFEEKTGIKVNILPLGYSAMRDKMITEFYAKSPSIDIASVSTPWLEEMYPFLVPLEEYFERDNVDPSKWFPAFLEMQRYPSLYSRHPKEYKMGDGTIYTVPVRYSGMVTYYRTDLFREVGLSAPDTMEEFATAAKKLTLDTDGDGKVDIHGVGLMGFKEYWGPIQWIAFLAGFGGSVLDRNYENPALDTPEALRAGKFFVDLYKKGYAPPGTVGYGLEEVIAEYQKGRVAMTLYWSQYYQLFENPELSEVVGKTWEHIPPYDAEHFGPELSRVKSDGWGLGINKYSKNKEAAWKLMNYLTSYEAQRSMAIHHANACPLMVVYDDPEYKKAFPADVVKESNIIATGRQEPVIREWEKIMDILGSEINRLMMGEKTVEEILSYLQQEIRKILR